MLWWELPGPVIPLFPGSMAKLNMAKLLGGDQPSYPLSNRKSKTRQKDILILEVALKWLRTREKYVVYAYFFNH